MDVHTPKRPIHSLREFLNTLRAASQECIDRRLQEIGTILARAGDGAPQPHPTWVSRPEF